MYIDENIIRFTYDFSTVNWKNNSGKCEGSIYFDVFDQTGEILNWYIKFKKIKIDTYTTPSWFEKNNSNFRYRESLFKVIWNDTITQEKRPSQKSNNIFELNDTQIKLVNEWFESNYKSTFKNIIAIISGNNPTGSFTDPNAAQMYISNDNIDEKYRKNFIMFFDRIWKITKDSNKETSFFENYKLEPIKIGYIDFLKNKNDTLINLLDELCGYNKVNKNSMTKQYILNIENKFGPLIKSKQQLKNKISEYRNSKNLPNLNYFEISSTTSQKAHIKGVSLIQKEKFEELNQLCNLHFFKNKLSEEKYMEKKNEIFDSTKKEIMCKDNLLKMSPNIHILFDDDYFTYSSENGNIIWNKNKLNKLTNADKEIILKEYSKINDLEHRKKFLISRNTNLKNFIS